jgi:hypothetical protein
MTAVRRIPLPLHAALRMVTGLLTMLVPFLAGFDAPAMLMAVAIGAAVTGVALSAVADERGRTALPLGTLHTLDYGLVIGLFLVAVIVAAAGDQTAGVVLTAIAAVQLVGNALTRYSLRS